MSSRKSIFFSCLDLNSQVCLLGNRKSEIMVFCFSCPIQVNVYMTGISAESPSGMHASRLSCFLQKQEFFFCRNMSLLQIINKYKKAQRTVIFHQLDPAFSNLPGLKMQSRTVLQNLKKRLTGGDGGNTGLSYSFAHADLTSLVLSDKSKPLCFQNNPLVFCDIVK